MEARGKSLLKGDCMHQSRLHPWILIQTSIVVDSIVVTHTKKIRFSQAVTTCIQRCNYRLWTGCYKVVTRLQKPRV